MSRVRPPTQAARAAYHRTHYAIGPVVLHIGRRPSDWPFDARSLVLIGACNPSGQRLPDGVNIRLMRQLRARLGRAPSWRGQGSWHAWSEPFFAVACPLPKARVLARLFGQNAVVLAQPHRRVRLVWLA
ncbi:DUF3293 domain-containing protein [Asaia siamensis]|uniref:DUF3293 domain-containing protein n=1 Tax=Asaia siamensis TaxID=110479 RepID=UPI001668BAA3|nr:DUF3293 domain-containing protein [Asaia siamensis]